MVSSGTVLPPYCVKTNIKVAWEDVQQRQLHWCSSLIYMLAMLSGPLFVLCYLLGRKKILLSYGLTPAVEKKYRTRRKLTWLVTAALFIALVIMAGSASFTTVLVIMVLLSLAILGALFGNRPLRAVAHRNGEYWIEGCAPEFLERLQGHSPW